MRVNHLTYKTCQCLGFNFIYGRYLQFSNHRTAHPNRRLPETFLHFPSSITTIASARCRRNYMMGKMIGIQAITDPSWVHLCENKQIEQVIERILSACHPHHSCSTSDKEACERSFNGICESTCMKQSEQGSKYCASRIRTNMIYSNS